MFLDFLRDVAVEAPDNEALVWNDRSFSYKWIFDRIDHWKTYVAESGIKPGQVVAIEGDFSPNSVALFLALVEQSCILVPLTKAGAAKRDEFIEVSDPEISLKLNSSDEVHMTSIGGKGERDLYDVLRERQSPGLVVFSSGSSGKSKATVHDVLPLLEKFKIRKRKLRMISFLLFDHLGGINTLLYALSNGGTIIIASDRSPESVLVAIDKHKVELLPTSPTFINLLLLSDSYKKHDLSSLRLVTYGTEPMPETTLKRFHQLFPEIRLQQTYGLTELGVLRSQSKASDSLWVKIGGEGFQTRVVDGILHIKSESVMLGYLNAPSPFTDDGWFDTNDTVTVDGEYLLIHGRKSEIINVGGEKVHPTEVESVIQEIDGVEEVTVSGEPNAIIGNIICATIRASEDVDEAALIAQVKKHCSKRLQRFKVPMKVWITTDSQHSERFKKQRKPVTAADNS